MSDSAIGFFASAHALLRRHHQKNARVRCFDELSNQMFPDRTR